MTRALTTWVAGLLTAAVVSVWGQAASAQSVQPFMCTGNIYQVQSGQLRIFDPNSSSYQDVGTNQGSYNAAGFNTQDNFAYASQGSYIIRIGADGSTERVFNIGSGSFSGDVDDSNNYWLRSNNRSYRKIDLATGSIDVVDFSGSNRGVADVTYLRIGGEEFLIGFVNSIMVRYNITTGLKEDITITGGQPNGGYGATWTDASGRLFAFNNNSGEIWEIFGYETGAPTTVFVAQADSSGNNDGFSCPEGTFEDLPPLAFDDDYTTPVNVAVVDNVLEDNGNDADNDPDGFPLTVTTTPVTGPSNGTVVLDENGNFTYTPDTNFVGVDTFVYQITDQAGLTDEATVTITIEGTFDFEIAKSLPSGPVAATFAGEVLTYEVVIENTGDIPLTDVEAEDTAPDGTVVILSNPSESGLNNGQLDVGETWTYTYTYSVTQDDIDRGTPLVNTVTATTDETGTVEKDSGTSTPISQTAGYTLTKSVDEASLDAPGLLTYEIVVTNDGNVTLTNAQLTDTLVQGANGLTLTSGPDLSGDNDNGNLDVGEVWTYAATFEVTQAEIDDANDIVNTADFTTLEAGDRTAFAETTIATTPAVVFSKAADVAVLSAPGLITYEITAQNDGNVSLTGVSLGDALTQGGQGRTLTSGPDLSGDIDADGEIDIDETWVYTATFQATQGDIDNGATILNTATLATNELPNQVADAPTTITQTPSFTFAKSVDQANLTAPATLRYEIAVVNDGNVTLTGIDFQDTITQDGTPLAATTGPTLTGDIDGDGNLDVGENWLYVITLDVEQPQIDNGNVIINDASFEPDELPVQADDAETTITQLDALDLTKSVAADMPTSFAAVGDQIDFTFVVENTGNTTRPGPITITDDQIGAGLECQPGDLAPMATATCTFTWTAAQADLDAGFVTNTAQAFSGGLSSAAQQATVTAVQMPDINIEKELQAPLPDFEPNNDLNYTFVVTNTGNVSLQAPITVTDPLVTNVTCGDVPTGGLPPLVAGAPLTAANSISCTGSYEITLADVEVGSITNVATVSASFNGALVEDQNDAVFPVNAAPKLDLIKATDPAVTSFTALGDQITYTYEVTNNRPADGQGVAIINPVIITDDRLAAPVTCYDPNALNASGQANGPFSVGETITCAAVYTVTQADLDAEFVTNTATASSTYAAADGSVSQVISPPQAVTVTAELVPSISLAKTVDAGAPNPAPQGAAIPYTIVATNNGEQTLSNVAITDPQLGALTCTPATAPVTLAPDETLTCTGSYTVTQADIDNQTVGDTGTAVFTNTATVSANDPFGETITAADDADHALDPALPELSILKELFPAADPAYTNVGDVLRFRMMVTNTGNTTINAIEVEDSLVAGTCPIASLAPDAQDQTCLFDYVVTQADIDNGSVLNTGTVTGQPVNPGSEPVGSSDDLTSQGPAKLPMLEVAKDGILDLGADGVAGVGDEITYTITVANTGNVTITDTVVTDPVAAPLAYAQADDVDGNGSIDRLAPGDSAVVTATYVLVQDDIDRGTVTNTALAEGTDPDSNLVTDTSDSVDPNDGAGADDPTVTTLPRGPSMAVEKTVSNETEVEADTELAYSYVVRNTGNVTLTDVTLVDQHTSASGTAPLTLSPNNGVVATLAPGEQATFTATYTVTQGDIDAGADLTNTVTATSTSPAGTTAPTATDDESVDLDDRLPEIEVRKSVSLDSEVAVGTALTYTYDVENTGNVTLTDVALADQHTASAGTTALAIGPNDGTVASLLPGEIATFTASYTVTQADIDAGADLTNIATVTALGPAGTTPPTDDDDAVVDLEDSAPSLEAIKTVQSTQGSDAGDDVVFQITVANNGNVTLSDVVLTDTLTRADGTTITPVPAVVWDTADDGLAGVLDVGEDWVYTLTYTLSQADVDAGGITNSVLAQALGPDGAPANDVSDNGAGDGNDPTPVLIPVTPSIEAVKVITSTTTDLGGTVRFEIMVTNTGNVTLSDVAITTDDLTRNDDANTPLTLIGPSFAGTTLGSSEGTLQVGETATFRASYVLTQDDIDAGGIANTATATGTPPIGGPVTDVSDDNGAGDDPTVLTIAPAPSILFDKRLAAGSGPSFDAVDEVLSFEFEITNTGNITLTPPYLITDPLIAQTGGTVTCPASDILPDASIICTGNYQVTQDDIDAGGITNVATATVGDAAPITDQVFVPSTQNPALAFEKLAPSIDPVDFVTGLVVTYTFVSTNNGNTTLIDPITIDDALFDASDYICDPFPAGGLAPDATYTCTANYTITADDVALAVVVNNAAATSGSIASNLASQTIPNNGVPALAVEKTIIQSNQPDGSDSGTLTFDEVGDQLVYQFEVTNTGTIAFARDVEVVDTRFADPIACFVPTNNDPELASSETAVCSAIYTVTQDDVDAGEVLNEAFARTDFGSIPTRVLSLPDDVTVIADVDPSVTIEKTVAELTYAAVGDVLNYDITVTNTGNQTLTNIAVNDPLLPSLVCDAATLAVGDQLTCSGSYTVTQDDIDTFSITNVATVTGVGPTGAPIEPQQDDATSNGPIVTPTLALEKTATPDPFGAVGSDVTFAFEVTNTSIYTISGITVTDALVSGDTYTCDVGTLAPQETSLDCAVTTNVTQADVDAGEIVNTATAAGTAAGDIPVTVDDTVTVDGPARAPSVELTKIADVPSTTVGSVVTYTFFAENTGNVSLDNVEVSDDLSRNDGEVLDLTTPVTLQMSGGFPVGDLDADGALDPAEVWTFTSTYQITQDDINAGGISNSATVFAEPPGPGLVFDASDDGNDGDGNETNDPTEIPITTDPVLDVEKVIIQTAGAASETVIFEIRAANRGNVQLFNVVPTDTLSRADGTDLSGDIVGPDLTSTGDTILDPGEVWTWEVAYTLTQDDIDAGQISNTATVSAADIGGVVVEDVSDNGDNADGNVSDDPTTLRFAPAPQLDVTKTVASIGTRAGEEAVFTILAVNTGNVTLAALTLDDTMTNADGTILAPITVEVTGLIDAELPPAETATFTVSYVLTQADVDSGSITNTATVNATTPSGGPIFDTSDNGDDGDGNTADDPTVAPIVQTPAAVVTKTADTPTRLQGETFEVNFTMTVENTGNVTLTDLVIEDDLAPFLASATLLDVDTPALSGFDIGTANGGYDGLVDVQLVQSGASITPGSLATIVLTVRYDTSTGQPSGDNTITVTANELALPASAATDVIQSEVPDILASKTASPVNAQLGDTITYVLRFENRLETIESAVRFVDTLPDGMVYTPETSVVTAAIVGEPEVAGRSLTWGPVDMAPGQVIEITYQTRLVGGTAGEYINTAIAVGPDGQVLSNVAAAIVYRRAEAVFDCTDIIGKVFDDRNMNGYQDGVVENRDITDQNFEGGKLVAPVGIEPGGEPGLPNVRLATPDGTLITTDEYGRYSVPCAALPADIGSNFMLKLDTRTLPTGYFVTTENPRVVRTTSGTLSRLNFGAALGNLVEVDLMAPAFVLVERQPEPSPALAAYVDQLISQIRSTPSVVRLTYYRAAEDQRTANARLDALETLIRDRWDAQGRYRLTIERIVRRTQ